ncbi:IS3 family transposase [Leptospira idonii]|uniref:IS3 family transposase n=1 Tax=Leptospira idonii TaxID=1193500 RepID=UPI001FE48F66|nr:IS3 family transposase [Leptospira idonii]
MRRREHNSKKVYWHFHKRHTTKIERYGFIKKFSHIFAVVKLCQVLEVSKSGFYDWKKRQSSPRTKYNQLLVSLIKEIHHDSNSIYGSPRIHKEIERKGYRCSRRLVEKLMRVSNIRSKTKRKSNISTTNSVHELAISPNRLKRNFTVPKPGTVFCSDFTYIPIKSKHYFLVVIIDLFNREIVSWNLSDHQQTSSLMKCFREAVKKDIHKENCIFHSDRGGQYASNEFRMALNLAKMKQSMSRSGDCWDNAVVESFFKTLKNEFIKWQKFETLEEAKHKIFNYIEIFYNRKRLHSTLDFTSPMEFRKIYDQRIA